MSRGRADAWIAALGLAPHPEGGRFVETWRDAALGGGRGAGTAIYFLLRAGETSRWHRIDATEIWHHYDGAPLLLETVGASGAVEPRRLGTDLASGERPQLVVPPFAWQRARSLGDYTLVGCTVSPAFDFDRFEIAPDDFEPGAR